MANVSQRRIAGNLAFCAKSNPKLLYDAFGPDVVKHLEDFVAINVASDAAAGWTTTLVEAGASESTLTLAQASGGALLLTTDANENDGVTVTLNGESYGFSSSQKATYFGARLQVSEATQSDFMVGLCITSTTLLAGITDGVYFRKVDGSTALEFVTEKDSTETATTGVLTVVAATNYALEFYFDGTSIEAFVNGSSVAKHTANIPNDELLTPSVEFLAGATTAKTMQIDWIKAIQVGRS